MPMPVLSNTEATQKLTGGNTLASTLGEQVRKSLRTAEIQWWIGVWLCDSVGGF